LMREGSWWRASRERLQVKNERAGEAEVSEMRGREEEGGGKG
jgi:hypothetical protein